MQRREFLSGVGVTLAAACAGGLAACGGKGDDPAPNPPGGGGGGGGSTPKLTANLTSEVTTVGSFKLSDSAILIRTGNGNTAADFSALTRTCTHMGCQLSGISAGKIECGSACGHGSKFNFDGTVSNGPATTSLPKLTIEISGSTLTVK
ncbi:QcrA and Rieske domain-containing protein [Chitinophaga lutea]